MRNVVAVGDNVVILLLPPKADDELVVLEFPKLNDSMALAPCPQIYIPSPMIGHT